MATWEELKTKGSEHYRRSEGIQPIDLYRDLGIFRSFALASIIKYAVRNANHEEPIKISDMEKIKHYAELLIADAVDNLKDRTRYDRELIGR